MGSSGQELQPEGQLMLTSEARYYIWRQVIKAIRNDDPAAFNLYVTIHQEQFINGEAHRCFTALKSVVKQCQESRGNVDD